MNFDKFVKSYITGLKTISQYPTKLLTEKLEFEYEIDGKMEKQVYNIGCVIPDCPNELLGKWAKINCMLNSLYEKDKKVGDMLDVEFKRLDGIK